MGTRSKDKIRAMIAKDMLDIHNRFLEVKKSINDNKDSAIEYLQNLLSQIPQSASGPLITKTPKVLKKRGVQRIETIPENDVVIIDNTFADSIVMNGTVDNKDNEKEKEKENAMETTVSRVRREASKKAVNNMKKQQSLLHQKKLRRPSDFHEESYLNMRESRSKRKKSQKSSSDEDNTQGPTKLSKTEKSILRESTIKKSLGTNLENTLLVNENITQEIKHESSSSSSRATRSSTRKRTLSQANDLGIKEHDDIIDTTIVVAPKENRIEEHSMYEDAIERPMPIMNSTMNLNSTYAGQKMMNMTVVLEPLSAIKLNETVTINKKLGNSIEKDNQWKVPEVKPQSKSPRTSKDASSQGLQDRMQQLKEAMTNKEFDELITEDESSPEIKKPRKNIKKQESKKRQKQIRRSATSSEDEILATPAKPLKEANTGTTLQEMRNMYKSNALFSPYAKESVKKRVEAFEQAGMNSPKLGIEIDAPTRITRTKTRAIAAAQAESLVNTKAVEKTVAHKLARKSLAKAKKISLAKQVKDTDEYKENKVQTVQRLNKAAVHLEKPNLKQHQQKTTPLGKTKIQLPMSVSRIPQTPSNQIGTNHSKALSAARANIITSVESFIQAPKSVNKRNSIEKLEEKKRRLNDDDAKKKREDALRLQMEEKRRKRQEKELKNKLAREAKEKQELEKRLKMEKEREERARMAQQMQEKQREEMEKKRLAQLQRAQEKEERRRHEEQQRLQRLQDQEEAERVLAEQRRREQEAEKRREIEVRAQQHAAAEAVKAKNQMLTAQAKYGHKHNGPTNYVLDSEPDDDESDDESRPKHAIPYWAQPQIRRAQLAVQRYIPESALFKFFDTKKCTPDLTQLFQGIDRSRLKRTSSAIWKTPPRYSMMDE